MKHAELILRLGHQPMVQRLPVHYPALYAQYDTWALLTQAQLPRLPLPRLNLLVQEARALAKIMPVCFGARSAI
jgi:hypothetical protein